MEARRKLQVFTHTVMRNAFSYLQHPEMRTRPRAAGTHFSVSVYRNHRMAHCLLRILIVVGGFILPGTNVGSRHLSLVDRENCWVPFYVHAVGWALHVSNRL